LDVTDVDAAAVAVLLQVPRHLVRRAQAWEEGLQSPPDSCPITLPAQTTLFNDITCTNYTVMLLLLL
jgi:hypothetical protein